MTSNAYSVAANSSSQNLNDVHVLQSSGAQGPTAYNATTPWATTANFGTNDNYGFWFDRDGVDSCQAALWGALDGQTYNTNGIYDIEILLHAIDTGKGTMFATINRVDQGFYTAGWKNAAPDITPAGRGFRGDMTNMQVFVGLSESSSASGSVLVSDITVQAIPESSSMLLVSIGSLAVAGAARRGGGDSPSHDGPVEASKGSSLTAGAAALGPRGPGCLEDRQHLEVRRKSGHAISPRRSAPPSTRKDRRRKGPRRVGSSQRFVQPGASCRWIHVTGENHEPVRIDERGADTRDASRAERTGRHRELSRDLELPSFTARQHHACPVRRADHADGDSRIGLG